MTQLKSKKQSRLGSWMSLLAWILFLVLLTRFFSIVLDELSNPNRELKSNIFPDGTKEIILRANRYNHYIMLGKINGIPVEFLIDTGASAVSIPEHLKDLLKLKSGVPIEAETANGKLTVYFTKIKLLEIGPVQLRQVSANLNPGMKSSQILLGMSVLKKFELVQKDNILIMRYISSQ